MKYKNKDITIRLYGKSIKTYNILITNNDKQSKILIKSINKLKERLILDPMYGDSVKKDLIPKEYSNFGNLYRTEISNFWRVIYSIKGNKDEIIVFVLEILNHKGYNKLFGYKS